MINFANRLPLRFDRRSLLFESAQKRIRVLKLIRQPCRASSSHFKSKDWASDGAMYETCIKIAALKAVTILLLQSYLIISVSRNRLSRQPRLRPRCTQNPFKEVCSSRWSHILEAITLASHVFKVIAIVMCLGHGEPVLNKGRRANRNRRIWYSNLREGPTPRPCGTEPSEALGQKDPSDRYADQHGCVWVPWNRPSTALMP